MHHIQIAPQQSTRAYQYQQLLPQLTHLIDPKANLIANMANICAALKMQFSFFWVGFYCLESSADSNTNNTRDSSLVLGPFQGTVACTRIAMGKGVCGAAALEQKTLIVPNVEVFPGHIACDALSRSEIVVPLVIEGETKFVLDIDSTEYSDFTEEDAFYLTQIVDLLIPFVS
ncbi:MAG: GAF domain-containing protein [Sphingobacteriales bacterium]|jgi:L-methionine (R)-S-oxide reductase|nr:GAF domain-containing protein [Sphingobacteriales bacterium]MBP9140392.1 GAF domain-containing protein [Chitinophagales bacterium]MDA0197342.1 GAF domain-containing protein [Bacteroidota bacterium]MBK6890080.1 GAF domain-containing protein [Sphingobacteriales bacterium]MBK7527394.1 GAF domain-containing protein [Sphingobacteriales bacterium]